MIADVKLITGSSNKPLAIEVSKILFRDLCKSKVSKFSDGEVQVEIGESVRGHHVSVIQSTCSPTNDNLMEMLIIIDALKRASASEITAVIPYYGYSRQDRKVAPRAPITAKLIADLISTAGADRVIAMDLHAGQIQGFFNVPSDNLFALPILMNDLEEQFNGNNDLIIVSPDAGGVERARICAKRMKCDLAIIDKRRSGPNQSEVMNIIGAVEGKRAVIIDDMIDTAGTLCRAAKAVVDAGAKSVRAYATHPVLSGSAYNNIRESSLEEVVVTNTIPLNQDKITKDDKIRQLSVAPLIAEAIKRVHTGESVSTLFDH